MKKVLVSLLLLVVCVLWIMAVPVNHVSAATGILKQINFQGKVVNKTAGTNVADGSYTFVFSIYSASSGGVAIWTETKSLTVTNGIFQTLLGDTTSLPGSLDFNTDNLYLGVNYNSDGEMSPRIRLAAVPYAFNALKVAGLNVTDTTGTLTVPTGKTIAFADAFTTSGANPLTLTTSGTTNVTLPTTGTLTTLAGVETFSNKTIGSTGLTFSGATTDITTVSNEDFTIAPNGSGGIVLNATTTIGASKALILTGAAGDPTATNGSVWYDSSAHKFKVVENGVVKVVCNTTDAGCGAGGGATALQATYDADANGSDATISLTSADDGIIFTNPSSSGTDGGFVLQLSQANTTANVLALDIVQSSNAANGVNLTANAIDAETGLAITADALTSGSGLTVTSSSTALTGALQQITLSGSDAGNTGSVLKVANTGTANANTSLYVDHRGTGTGNLALRIDDQSGDTTPVVVDGDGRLGVGTDSITGSTERLLQVGSETNRGNSVTYGEVVTKGLKDINTIANIKDVYVYDTTADSDGGRWIDWSTTEKLSWYTEALDDGPSDPCNIATDDRCYTNHFPRKAVLVVTSDALYIFDAATNDMWMKFSQDATGFALGVDTNNDPSSVTALNGIIYVGTNGTAASVGTKGTLGLYAIDFTQDRMWYYDDTDRSGADVGIGGRNGVVVYNSDNNTAFDLAVSGTIAGWKTINDVSVANIKFSTSAIAAASIPANGITMVALATDSGLTTINLSHQKVLQYSETTDNDYNAVAITSSAKLYGLNETLGQAEMWTTIDIDQVSEINGNPNKLWDETAAPGLSKAAPTILANAPDALEVVERGSLADGGVLSTAAVAGSSDLIYVGTNQGLTEIHDSGTSTQGWVKYYNTTRQTPLMPATIKRYLPMDEASGDLNDASITGAASANNRTMMSVGSPTYGVNGVRGKGMSFNGTSQFVCSDNNGAACATDTIDNMSTTAWNITVWFKHSLTASGTDMLYNKCYNTTPAQAAACVTIFMNNGGTMSAAIDDDVTWTNGSAATYDQSATSTQTYNDNQWHFATLQRTNASGILFSIDGKAITLTGTAPTATVDASQIVALGADCSVGAACATGANFWDGQIDDFTFSQGTTTVSGLTAIQMRRLYNDARPLINKKVVTVSAATTATASTIGDSGESWIPNEFAGQIVTLTANTGAGQTRRIVSNTATVLTVSPDFDTPPDTTTDFKIDPEALYGASNNVTAIGVSAETPVGEARVMCAGTNSGTDTGGVTCYNHQAGPNIVANVYHADAKQIDDSGATWTGTDYDDIQSVDLSGRALVIGSMAHSWTETEDVRLGQGLDYLASKLFDIRSSILNLGNQTLTGAVGQEVGLTGGADLAEFYQSTSPLLAGDVVALDPAGPPNVVPATQTSSHQVIGVVATSPGLILGEQTENAYPIALAGRIPVNVTNENGLIKAGDRLTTSAITGYASKALFSGRVLGVALEDANPEAFTPCTDNTTLQCGQVVIFVNLTDYLGTDIEASVQNGGVEVEAETLPPVLFTSQQEKLLGLLKTMSASASSALQSSSTISAAKVNAGNINVDTLTANVIKANRIEGLEMYTQKLDSLSNLYAQMATSSATSTEQSASKSSSSILGTNDQDANFVSLLGTLLSQEQLNFAGKTEFAKQAIFQGAVNFLQSVVFKDSVEFVQAPVFARDTAGLAYIEAGKRYADVTFERPYPTVPVISITSTAEIDQKSMDHIEKNADMLALPNQNYLLTNVTPTGFRIIVEQPAQSDLQFTWIAVSVKNLPSPRMTPSPLNLLMHTPLPSLLPASAPAVLKNSQEIEQPASPVPAPRPISSPIAPTPASSSADVNTTGTGTQ